MPLKVAVAHKAPANLPEPVLSIKVKKLDRKRVESQENLPIAPSPTTNILRAPVPPPLVRPAIKKSPAITNLLKPSEDIEMLDRDSSVSASSSISDSIINHVVHLEEEAEEWKDRIEDLSTSLSTKSRELRAMKEALTSMKAQKTRIQVLLQKVDASMQKTATQGQEMVPLHSDIASELI